MKLQHIVLPLGLTALALSPVLANETETSNNDANDVAITALCQEYAQEDGVSSQNRAAYLKECLHSMTDLSDDIQEAPPAVADAVTQAEKEQVQEVEKNTPDKMLVNEVVSIPDPSAERLTAKK